MTFFLVFIIFQIRDKEGNHKGCGVVTFLDKTTAQTVLKYCSENVIFFKQIALSEFTTNKVKKTA
jgi:hypothetical protein